MFSWDTVCQKSIKNSKQNHRKSGQRDNLISARDLSQSDPWKFLLIFVVKWKFVSGNIFFLINHLTCTINLSVKILGKQMNQWKKNFYMDTNKRFHNKKFTTSTSALSNYRTFLHRVLYSEMWFLGTCNSSNCTVFSLLWYLLALEYGAICFQKMLNFLPLVNFLQSIQH